MRESISPVTPTKLTLGNAPFPDLVDRHDSLTLQALRAFLRHRSGMVGLSLIVDLMAGLAMAAPLLAPHDPLTMTTADRFAPPSATYPMGADEFGRDIFSRLLYGGRVAFGVGSDLGCDGHVIGVTLGAVAGLCAGLV